jgi:hypothetical protein
MRTAKEIYEREQLGEYEEIANYQPMLEEFGKILIQVDDDDYQGSSFLLYEIGSGYGYLCFGWGSCSGCDELQACRSMEEVQELMDKLFKDIICFETLEDMEQFFNKEWELCHEGHEEAFPRFLLAVKSFIAKQQGLEILENFEKYVRCKTIEKACEWLRANTQIYACEMYDTDLVRMIEDFRKNMEEE